MSTVSDPSTTTSMGGSNTPTAKRNKTGKKKNPKESGGSGEDDDDEGDEEEYNDEDDEDEEDGYSTCDSDTPSTKKHKTRRRKGPREKEVAYYDDPLNQEMDSTLDLETQYHERLVRWVKERLEGTLQGSRVLTMEIA